MSVYYEVDSKSDS